jgi:hypothetical protein
MNTVVPNQSDRPDFYRGLITYDGQTYRFISGGMYGFSSAVYGDFGPLKKSLKVLGSIYICDQQLDPKTGKTIDGKGLGIAFNKQHIGEVISNGCILVHRHDWVILKVKLTEALEAGQLLYAHISKDGIVVNDKN